MDDLEVSPDAALLAALYASVHRGIEGDLAFYRNACRGAEVVLDLGCGSGRIALWLARDGSRVVGIDGDAALLSRARASRREESSAVRARLTLHHGDMRDAQLDELLGGEQVDRIVMAHSVAFCFMREELGALLPRLKERLKPDGILLFDTYPTDAFHADGDPSEDDPWGEVASVHVAGEDYRVLERSDWDRESQTLTAHYRYEPANAGTPRAASIVHHYLLAAQLETLLEQAGFSDILIQGDFSGGPLDEDASAMVIAASP